MPKWICNNCGFPQKMFDGKDYCVNCGVEQ